MTSIIETAFPLSSERQEYTEDPGEMQAYLDAREEAAAVMLATEPRVFGSVRLAHLLGVKARLKREF